MKSIRMKCAVAGTLLALVGFGVQAQELKIGYVNSDRVLREAAPAKAAQSKLETEFSKREKELTEVGNRLKAAGDKLEKAYELLKVPSPPVGRMACMRSHLNSFFICVNSQIKSWGDTRL